MNVKKKIMIVLTAMITLIPNINIKALDENLEKITTMEEKTEGRSSKFEELDPCGPDENGNYPDGCVIWSEDLVVKISLVDKNMSIVENPTTHQSTKTVEFRPYNPYRPWASDGQYTKHEDGTYGDGTYMLPKTSENLRNTQSNDALNPNLPTGQLVIKPMYTVNYSGVKNNMSVTATSDQLAEVGYYVYMGFGYCSGDSDEECDAAMVKNNFSDYENNRSKFIKYITSLERKQHVIDGDFDGNISFLDFFLKVSGYTDEWNYTEKPDALKSLDGYFLAIEPVYMFGQTQNGNDHIYIGTAKFLGNILWQNSWAWNESNSKYWLWLFNGAREPRFNFLCNFYDKSELYRQDYRTGMTGYWANPETYLSGNEWLCTNPNNAEKLTTTTMSNLLGYVQSPFGVNIIKIGEKVSTWGGLTSSVCNINVNTCQNDSYKFELSLTASGTNKNGIYDCIYPNKVESSKLDNYFFHIGENEKELWCYDNISYDFSELKESLNQKTIFGGKLREIPNGKLTVNRTCYSKEKPLRDSLIKVFHKDPGTYQDTFEFKLGDDTYQYKRNNKMYHDNGYYNEKIVCENESCRKYHYEYTSTIYYDYEINNSFDSRSKIGINNQNIAMGLSSSSSIQYESQYDNKSRIIMVKNQPLNLEVYGNALSADTSNAYGLSNKLYNQLKSKAKPSTSDRDDTNKYTANGRMQSGENVLNLYLDETTKQTCEVQTIIENTGGDCPPGDPNCITGPIAGARFRVISLDNPFPGRDGTLRMPSANWVNETENNVYDYIQNNRNVKTEEVYNKEPLYKITLDGTAMMKIREYNKTHSYGSHDITCENDTGRKCISNFLKDKNYIKNMTGTCANINSKNTTNYYSCADKTEKSGG